MGKINLKQIIFVTVIIVAAIIFIRSCGNSSCNKPKQNDTISVKHDTVFVLIKKDTVYQPKEVTVVQTKYVNKIIQGTDTLYLPEIQDVDTLKILADYYKTRFYSDTQKIQYGKILIQDSVSQNKITSRKFSTDLKVPIVTNTITLTQPKKNIGYIGFSGMGNFINPIYSIGMDLSLKNKSDKIYSIGVNYTKDYFVYYSFGFKLPIRLHK